jgi:ribonucleoside-diphosphate reductase alpha chain
MPVKLDQSRDSLLQDYAVGMLKDFYLNEYESSPQEGFRRASIAWSAGDDDLAQRLYDYVSKKWFMFASPVLSNAPNGHGQGKGMPISCFLTYVPDTLEGLIDHTSELRWLSVYGGGVGGHWSDVRTVSDVAPGPIPFLHTVDADMIAYRQGRTRKGSYAAYMDVSHPDIVEFLNMRIPTGDVQRKALNLHNALNITN